MDEFPSLLLFPHNNLWIHSTLPSLNSHNPKVLSSQVNEDALLLLPSNLYLLLVVYCSCFMCIALENFKQLFMVREEEKSRKNFEIFSGSKT